MDLRRPSLDELVHGPAALSLDDAAEVLGVSRAVAYRMAQDGTLPTIQVTPKRFVVPALKLAQMLGWTPEREEAV